MAVRKHVAEVRMVIPMDIQASWLFGLDCLMHLAPKPAM